MKTICNYCGEVHDMSMPMCDKCLEKKGIKKHPLKEDIAEMKIKECGDYFIAPLGKWFALYKFDTTYDNQILCSNEVWVLEEEMEKLTNKYNEPEQLRLFP